jgi:hypothetical protein
MERDRRVGVGNPDEEVHPPVICDQTQELRPEPTTCEPVLLGPEPEDPLTTSVPP